MASRRAVRQPARRTRRDLLLIAALVVLVLGGLAALAASTGWEETGEALSRITPGQLAILFALSLVNYVFRGLRWHLFSLKLGLPISAVSNVLNYLGGFLMIITPGRVGELVRMRWIRAETGWSFERTAPLVLLDRAADLAAMAGLIVISLIFATTSARGAIPVALLSIAVAYVATRPRLMRTIADAGYRATGRFARLFVRIRRAAATLEQIGNPGVLGLAALPGLLGWFAEGYALYLLLGWMGAEIDLWTAVGIFVFATLAGGLTGAPGGLGGAEAAMVVLLTAQGVPAPIAVPATLVIRVTTLWFAVVVGAMLFPLAEKQSKKARHALED